MNIKRLLGLVLIWVGVSAAIAFLAQTPEMLFWDQIVTALKISGQIVLTCVIIAVGLTLLFDKGQ